MSYNWNNKIRGHRRDGTFNAPDIASLVQLTRLPHAGEVHRHPQQARVRIVVQRDGRRARLPLSARHAGERGAKGRRDAQHVGLRGAASRGAAELALAVRQHRVLQRVRGRRRSSPEDAACSLRACPLKAATTSRMRSTCSTPTACRHRCASGIRRPRRQNIDKVLGFFVQDAWSVGREADAEPRRAFDHNRHPAGAVEPEWTYVGRQSLPESTPIKQNLFVWRTGLSYDPIGDGQTAIKASYSRYGLQVGVDRVRTSTRSVRRARPARGPIRTGRHRAGERNPAGTGFTGITGHYADARYDAPDSHNGSDWPYSDEVTAGVERQLAKDMRVGAMFDHRTNRNQIGLRNIAVPTSAYTAVTVTVPNGPAARSPVPSRRPRRPTTCSRPSTVCRTTSSTTSPTSTRTQRHRVHGEEAVLEPLADGRRASRSGRTPAA